MLVLTDHPRVFDFNVRDWHPQQALTDEGFGTRTELVCRVTFQMESVAIEYVATRFLRRDTPTSTWKVTGEMTQPKSDLMTMAIGAAFVAEILSLYPLEIR